MTAPPLHRVVEIAPEGPLFEGAIAVYAEAFSAPPYLDPDRGREVRSRLRDPHRRRPGFRLLVALEGERVAGMTYGYRGEPGQWWHDSVVHAVSREAALKWLADSYEVVEVAVDPARQSRGIGTALIAELLQGRPEATAVLSTRTDSDAHVLYRRLGFEVIVEMTFTRGGWPFYVMGKALH